MIFRTPPPKRPRDDAKAIESSPVGSDRRLVIYEDPVVQLPESSHEPQPSDHMLCTCQCRQMVAGDALGYSLNSASDGLLRVRSYFLELSEVKSDFLDALSNAEKQVCDYKSKLETLNENFCKAEAERKKFRDQFLYAEQELAAAKGREQALQQQLLMEINDSQERLKKQLELCSKLEIKLENERNLRKKAESSATSAEEKASVLEGKLSHLSESIDREKKCLNNELAQLRGDSELTVSRITADLERMEFRAKNAGKESELLKEQLEDLKLQLSECFHQKSELEKKLSSLTIQGVASTESNILVKHLQEELRNYESEVREARKLKSSYENIELLKEKLLEEKSRKERQSQSYPSYESAS
ncbi:hypothetical protein GH714_026891 [Hevea brasiliensis]|uniref:Uncharacterized protein n=1 Tax=Hevea brasiliensis TaxID=3981 RepID=A0A6A6N4D2_HEVBR|nr:hypothetical protein GH714_026891 [Hevea brasiliensis]